MNLNTKRFFLLGIILCLPFNVLAVTYNSDIQPLNKREFFQTSLKKNYREGEILIKYRKQKINLKKESGILESKHFESVKGFTELQEFKNQNTKLLKIDADKSVFKEIEKLKKDPNVEYAEPNYIRSLSATPNDPLFDQQWGLHNTGQDVQGISGKSDADIDATEAWDLEDEGGNEIVVAIIDTGVRYSHEDLSCNIWMNTDEIADNGIDDDKNGYVDDIKGWDFKDNDNDPNDIEFLDVEGTDISSHGTFIAGIIAGVSGNSIGISGASFHNKIKVMALRFALDTASELEAIEYAINNGAKIINASFGGDGFSIFEKNAIDSFPGIVVAAAGNTATDNDVSPFYPCSYSSNNIICVGSSDQNDNLSTFSNYGATSVDLVAPGENIVSTYNTNDSSYAVSDGTSFAAPFISASIAMAFSNFPTLNLEEIKNKILDSGDLFANCSTRSLFSTGKRLNLQYILNSTTPVSSLKCYPIYRFWSDQNQSHFYTASEDEKNQVIAKYEDFIWKYEGVAYSSYKSQETESIPVYRFWSDQNQTHFFTASEAEKDNVINYYDDSIWKYEGIAFYANQSSSAELNPIYRFWSDQNQSHFYTASEEEKNQVIANYDESVWKYEGIAWYVPK